MALTKFTKDENILVRGPAHAQNVFGLNNSYLHHAPKLQFENFIRFNFNADKNSDAAKHVEEYLPGATKDLQRVGAYVKTATYPDMSIDTETLNQYNKKRVFQKSIKFEPITVTMHDVADGLTLKFWELYYNWYYRDGHTTKAFPDKGSGKYTPDPTLITPSDFTSTAGAYGDSDPVIAKDVTSHNEYGFNIHQSRDILMPSIEMFYSRGSTYSKVILVNPKISAFKHDQLDYAGVANTMQLTFTIEYENAIYGNNNFELPTGTTDIRDRPAPTMPVIGPVPAHHGHLQRDITKDTTGKLATDASTSVSSDVASQLSLADRISGAKLPGLQLPGVLGNVVNDAVNGAVSNVQGQLGNIVGNIGSDVANSVVRGIQTGNFSLSPNPLKSAKQVFKNTGSNIVTGATHSATQTLSNAVSGGINDLANSVFSSSDPKAQAGPLGTGSGQGVTTSGYTASTGGGYTDDGFGGDGGGGD